MVKANFFSKWMKRLKPAKDSNQNMAGQPDDDDVIRFIVAHQTRILSRQAWEQFHARFHAQFPTLNSEKIFSLILIAEQNGAIPPANGAARAVLGPEENTVGLSDRLIPPTHVGPDSIDLYIDLGQDSDLEIVYLDKRTADVFFVFNEDIVHAFQRTVRVPAHKNILAANSSVFYALFLGAKQEIQYIPIKDASAVAFQEFLQLFYKSEFALKFTNIIPVAKLCKKYNVIDGLKACEDPLRKSLTIANMCTVYEAALFLELSDVVQLCEESIKSNAEAVLTSAAFLKCDRESLDKILQLMPSNCSASLVVNACMEWAKAECTRTNLEAISIYLKAKLQGSFGRIPFDKLGPDELVQFISTYSGFFDKATLESIIVKTMAEKSQLENQLRSFEMMN